MSLEKFGIQDRIALLNCLPREGNVLTLRLVRDLRNALEFPEDEQEALKMEIEDGRAQWDPSRATDKEIEIGDPTRDVIRSALRQLDAQNQLPLGCLPLYDRFVANA